MDFFSYILVYTFQFQLFISVLNTENGSVHLDKIVVKFDHHEDLVEQKPGIAHLQLKTSLYEKIRDKRRLELLKRLEETEKLQRTTESGK